MSRLQLGLAGSYLPSDYGAIIVTSNAELLAAFDAATGGETILLAPGNFGDVVRSNADFASEVKIKSQYGVTGVINRITFYGASNITFENILFYHPAVEVSWDKTVTFEDAQYIAIKNCEFSGSVDGDRSNDIGGAQFTRCDNITMDGNIFHDTSRAILFSFVTNSSITNSGFVGVRATPLQASGLDNVLFDGNMFVGPNANPGEHYDYIHLWQTPGTDNASYNVTVTNNVMIEGEGSAAIGFYFQHQGPSTEYRHSNFVFENNVLYASANNGIWAESTDGYIVRNNVLIESLPGLGPDIYATSCTDVTITDNIVSQTDLGPSNYIVQRTNPSASNHHDKLFINGLRATRIQDLLPIPGSPIDFGSGVGAEAFMATIAMPPVYIDYVVEPASTAVQTVTFEALPYPSGSLPAGTITYNWDFGDGGSDSGNPVSHSYGSTIGWMRATCTVTATGYSSVEPKTILVSTPRLVDITCDGVFANTGEALSATTGDPGGDASYSGSYADGGIVLTGSNAAYLENCADKLSGMEKITISMDCKRTAGSYLLNLFASYAIIIPSSGLFNVTIAGHSANASSGDSAPLYDGNWHNVHAVYDSIAGTMKAWIDGNLVISQTGLSGAVPAAAYTRKFVVGDSYPGTGKLTGAVKNIVVLNDAVEYADFSTVLSGLRAVNGTPRLTNEGAVKTGSTTATCTITTDQSGGIMYVCCTTDNTKPTAAFLKLGLDASELPTPNANQAVSSSGIQTLNVTGLTAATTYYSWFVQFTDYELNSQVIAGPSFTTDA